MKDKVNITYFESKLDINNSNKKTQKHNKNKLTVHNKISKNKKLKKYNKTKKKLVEHVSTKKNKDIDINTIKDIDINTIKDIIFRNFILDCKEFESYSVHFYVNVGSSNEENGNFGISHVLEHMIFKKTSYFKNAIELASYLEEYNIIFNAYTNFSKTCYMYSTNNNKSDSLKRIFFVAYQMLFELMINNKDMDIEKNIILQEYYQEQDNKITVIDTLFDMIYYGEHPYFIPTIGYINDIKKMNPSNIIEFYKKYYKPRNINCFIFGNTPSTRICIKYFNQYFMKQLIKNINKPNSKISSNIKIISSYTNKITDIKTQLNTIKSISHNFNKYTHDDAYKTLQRLTDNNDNILNIFINSNIKKYLDSNLFNIHYSRISKQSKHKPDYIITTKLQNMKQAYIYLIIPNNGLNDSHKNEIKLFTNIIGNKKLFSNVLFNIFREKYGVSYNINVGNNLLINSGYSYIILKVNHNDLDKTIKILNSVISRLIKDCKSNNETKSNLITRAKFNKIKKFLITDINTLYDSIGNIETLYVDKLIYQYDIFNLNTYKDDINNVKYKQFKTVIHKYLQNYLLYIFK